MRTENNNYFKERHSRPAILDVILNKYGQQPISFLELLGDGTGAEFYSTWLNIDRLVMIERDRAKWDSYDLNRIELETCQKDLLNWDLNQYIKLTRSETPLDVVNLDFCTYLYDNGKQTCTAAVIDNLFKYGAVKNGGLVFFTFMVRGIGVNFHKRDAIVDEEIMFSTIEEIAARYNYTIERKLFYTYCSGHPTHMANLGIQVNKITEVV